MSENNFSRRKFLTGAAALGAAGAVGFNPFVSCSSGGSGPATSGGSFKNSELTFSYHPCSKLLPMARFLRPELSAAEDEEQVQL
jgi:myo-inositol 2-dehydrogenase / D-chiro-inositol 1-dehydrogenase